MVEIFIYYLINIPIRLLALTGHEFAHGYVSKKLGDPTPQYQGRLTFNPLAHLDPIGTILMVLTGFGWAKPVQVDPRYYKNPKHGMAITALAGPLANLIMAIISLVIYTVCLIVYAKYNAAGTVIEFITMITQNFAVTNLCFMVFNLIPIPPLDGSKVLGIFLPNNVYYKMLQYEKYSMLLIMVLSLSGAFGFIINNGVNFFFNAILRGIGMIAGLIL